ncbi:MAG: tetraacyldisaccharide 4'-kinase [Candidatus Brocadiia bacterium]
MSLRARFFRLHRRIICPGEGGALLGLLRVLLRPAAALYGLAVRARNWLYRKGLKPVHSAEVPVLSVGNITAGGTGKTPMVAWLARLMVIHNRRPAILSRGYGRRGELGIDDENTLLSREAEDVPIVVNPDRVKGAESAVREHGADVLIMDDGFQHRRLARGLDIVLIDAVWPFGGDHMLPRGLLREPLRELQRANVLLITRAGLVGEQRLEEIKERLGELAPEAAIACCVTEPSGLRALRPDGNTEPPRRLRRGRWAAFCGIGNPEGFRLTLEDAGCRLALFRVFADHEPYTLRQLEEVLSAAQDAGCDGVVTTEKDAVKVERLLPEPSPPLYALQVELELTEGSAELTNQILAALGQKA